MKSLLLCAAFFSAWTLGLVTPASAVAFQALENAAPEVRVLAPVMVTGVQLGPRLWKVSKGEHVLWVLGTLSVLPKDVTWESKEVEEVIAHAQAILEPSRTSTDLENVGFFRRITLLPALYKTTKNPKGARLADVVPPAMFARWKLLWKQYGDGSSSIEKYRPSYVGYTLKEQAFKHASLRQDVTISETFSKLAKKYRVPVIRPTYTLPSADPKQFLADLQVHGDEDLACFGATLDLVEHDLDAIQRRANAWAAGDLDELRAVSLTNMDACATPFSTDVIRKYGLSDISSHLASTWLSAATTALETNEVTFAVLPVDELFRDNGYLSLLRAQGYVVETPAE